MLFPRTSGTSTARVVTLRDHTDLQQLTDELDSPRELAAAQTLTDSVVAAVRERVVAALVLGTSAVAAERGIDLVVEDETAVDEDAL